MRLICPNCDAQYEVPSEVIPDEGRDVQCSNCGQTWYQYHPDHIPEEKPFDDMSGSDDAPEQHHDVTDDLYTDEITFVEQDDAEDARDEAEDAGVEPPAAADAPAEKELSDREASTAPVRRELDPAIAEVLRAEAEREAQARKQEGVSGMESQPELGLPEVRRDEAKQRAQEAQERMARMRGYADAGNADDEDDELYASTVAAVSARRDLLPDIEEINSTLRSNNDRSPETDPGQTAQVEALEKRSSRKGFTLTILLVGLCALLYVFAGQLAESIPQAALALENYVNLVDSGRAWLDAQLVALLTWLDTAAGGGTQQ